MKTSIHPLLAMALAAMAVSVAVASPLKVKTEGTKGQNVVMCPDCKEKLACAKAGDYTIGFAAEVDNPKLGNGKIIVHVKDKGGKPVTDAEVVVKLTMPEHKHGKEPLVLKSAGHGAYAAATQLGMGGTYHALVQVAPKGGDAVQQTFSFAK
jgi:hypothetical protein